MLPLHQFRHPIIVEMQFAPPLQHLGRPAPAPPADAAPAVDAEIEPCVRGQLVAAQIHCANSCFHTYLLTPVHFVKKSY